MLFVNKFAYALPAFSPLQIYVPLQKRNPSKGCIYMYIVQQKSLKRLSFEKKHTRSIEVLLYK